MTDTVAESAEEIIYLDDGWEKIESVGIKPFLERVESFDTDELDTKPNPMQEFLSTYDTVFQMCIQREPYNYSDRLYQSYQDSFSKYFKNHFIPSLREAKAKSELEFLNEFARRWQQNQYAVLGMQRMFCYLDRFYVPNNEDLLGMKEYGYSLYKDIVFEQFNEDARESILKCIKAERDGVEQNRELLRSCVMVFVNLGNELRKVELKLYKENFQKDLLKHTTEYYKVASEKWLSTLSCPEYLMRAEEAIEQELGRLNSFLHNSSEEDLMREVRVEILANHQDQLLTSSTGIVNMLEDNKSDDLSRLFNLYSDVDKGLIPVAKAMQEYICKLGDEYIAESKEEKSKEKNSKHVLIQNLIALHDRFLKIVKNEFKSHREFTKAMKDAFEKFINEEYYTSNYLARYVNDFFRKGGIGQNFKDDELDQQMLHIVMLYGYIRDKDVFETNYQAYLASRLLSDSSASEQNEKKMIGKLKQESGYHWTQKLEDMFTDIQRSKELMKVFNRAHQNELDLQMNVAICTQGAWPSTTIPKCVVPVDLANAVDRFTNFYEGKHVGRKLQFRWDKGTAELSVRFNDKCEKVLVVTTYQMMVLLLFNHSSGPVLTYQQILDGTGISGDDLKPALLSLAHPKSKVLMKRPNGPKLEPEHKLRLNFKFSHPQSRIHVPMLKLAKQQKQENMETQSQITVQRKHQVDAAIVRIMKARKQLNHAVLVSDVRNQLQARFDAQPALIKSRIESLINLEYLERDPDNRTTYLYKQ